MEPLTTITTSEEKKIIDWIKQYCKKNAIEHENFLVSSKNFDIQYCYTPKTVRQETASVHSHELNDVKEKPFRIEREFNIQIYKNEDCWYKLNSIRK